MRALVFERSLPRYAAARAASTFAPGRGARVGPLRLGDIDHPSLPSSEWTRVRTRLAGICGSDLATVDGRSSTYFEPIVSFPFVPGHEVVGELEDGTRVVLEPVLNCFARAIDPPCASCARGQTGNCERIAFGELSAGLQTGFCSDTGGGWGAGFIAHQSQLHEVPSHWSDEAAVMVEPTACAIHAVMGLESPGMVAVIGAGTLGLCVIAALNAYVSPGTVITSAKYPAQQRLARQLGASVITQPTGLERAVRRETDALKLGRQLTTGVDVVVDCVGTSKSVSQALSIVKPRGRIIMVGMPGRVSVDLTSLWHREIELVGAYAYGQESISRNNGAKPERTFKLAFELVEKANLESLVSALYPIDRYRDAIEHAATAGQRGGVKIAFDLREEDYEL